MQYEILLISVTSSEMLFPEHFYNYFVIFNDVIITSGVAWVSCSWGQKYFCTPHTPKNFLRRRSIQSRRRPKILIDFNPGKVCRAYIITNRNNSLMNAIRNYIN